MELNRRNIKIVAAVAAGAIAFHWALQNIVVVGAVLNTVLGLLAPFVFGLIIAFILNVPMRAIERTLFARFKAKGKRKFMLKLCRPISFLLTLVILAAVLVLVMFIVIPEIGRTFQTLSVGFPAFVERAEDWANQMAKRIPEFAAGLPEINLNWDKIGETAFGFLQSGATSILSSTMGIATSVFSGIFNFFLGTIFAVYILFQKERLTRQSKKLLYAYLPERKADSVVGVCVLSNRVFSKFISGQCLEACILGLLFFISMSIFRFPYAMMISVLIAFTALIPVFGAFIGCVVGAFLILVSDPVQAFWFIILFLVLQQIEGNLIYPRVVGSSVGLPAMWVMLAVLIGGSAMGMFGMLVSVPFCSVVYTLLKTAANRRLKSKGTLEEKYQAG